MHNYFAPISVGICSFSSAWILNFLEYGKLGVGHYDTTDFLILSIIGIGSIFAQGGISYAYKYEQASRLSP